MRIVRKQKRILKKRPSPLERIRNQVDIFESEGVVYAHMKHQTGIWEERQCVILDGNNSTYRGIEIYEMERHPMKLEDLDQMDLNFLIRELA